MAKAELTTVVEPLCRQLAEQMAYELVDVCLDKETTGKYLRIYIDKPDGITLDDCEVYHRAIQPKLENYDYDFLEVSSPGIDRPLKKDRDFERAVGEEIEIHLFKAMDGRKTLQGHLIGLVAGEIVIDTPEGEKRIARKAAALVKPIVDMEGVEELEF